MSETQQRKIGECVGKKGEQRRGRRECVVGIDRDGCVDSVLCVCVGCG